CLQGIEYPYSF
nr:immunoglobulin light chain junction region [Macaca mulatta]MOW43034.1 immunoglobulin light chain junction region [Macaca mulatta]MOW44084.1 immunoglobulin light chain junction region [Macaca mulatta]